jgi:hypothetical protein
MGLNAVGSYGFLAKAHIGHQVEGETAVGARLADIEGRISMEAGMVADLTGAIGVRPSVAPMSLVAAIQWRRAIRRSLLANMQRHGRQVAPMSHVLMID